MIHATKVALRDWRDLHLWAQHVNEEQQKLLVTAMRAKHHNRAAVPVACPIEETKAVIGGYSRTTREVD